MTSINVLSIRAFIIGPERNPEPSTHLYRLCVSLKLLLGVFQVKRFHACRIIKFDNIFTPLRGPLLTVFTRRIYKYIFRTQTVFLSGEEAQIIRSFFAFYIERLYVAQCTENSQVWKSEGRDKIICGSFILRVNDVMAYFTYVRKAAVTGTHLYKLSWPWIFYRI